MSRSFDFSNKIELLIGDRFWLTFAKLLWKQKILGFFIDGPNTLFLNEMSFPRKKQRCVLFSNRELRLFPYVIDAGSEVSFSEAVKRPFIFN